MMDMQGHNRWCILRTGSGSTLPLAKSLTDAGLGVWTPLEVRPKRTGKNRELVETEMPILPGIVFAPFECMAELLMLSRSPSLNYRVWDSDQKRMVVKGHPDFSVFRMHGEYRSVSEHSLTALRDLERDLDAVTLRRRQSAKRKGEAPKFKAGQIVCVDGGGFEGLKLTVAENNEGKVVKLIHDTWLWNVEISAWNLRHVNVTQASPEQGAALAA